MNVENITDIAMYFNDPEWILDHITIALQRTSDKSLVKRPCDLDGIEQYLILQGKKDSALYSVKVFRSFSPMPVSMKKTPGIRLLKI